MRTAKWLVPAPRCFTLPLAVIRKRFLVALCVFILGINTAFSKNIPPVSSFSAASCLTSRLGELRNVTTKASVAKAKSSNLLGCLSNLFDPPQMDANRSKGAHCFRWIEAGTWLPTHLGRGATRPTRSSKVADRA